MRIFKSKTIKQFEREFHKEEIEMIVLTKEKCICINNGGDYEFIIHIAATFDPSKNEVNIEPKELRWYDKKSKYKYNYNTRDGIGVLNRKGQPLVKKYQICRVRVRECIKDLEYNGIVHSWKNNRYMLVEMLSMDEKNEQLEKVKKELLSKTIIKKDYGTFTLNRSLSEEYEGTIKIFNSNCKVYLCTDNEQSDKVIKGIEILENIIKNENSLKKRIEESIIEKYEDMVSNGYYKDDKDFNKKTKNDILQLRLNEIHINTKQNYVGFYFDDVFFGFSENISVNMNSDLKISNVEVPYEYEQY